MDYETFLILSEGEAIHFGNVIPWETPRLAKSFNELGHITQYQWFRAVLEQSGLSGPHLDVASGSGYGTEWLSRSSVVTRSVGVDKNERHVSFAREHFPSVEFVHGDAEQLASLFDHRSFTFVTSGQTLEHLIDPVAFVRGASRVLRDDGIFCVMTPTHDGAPLALKMKNPWHIFEFNPDFMATLMGFFFHEVKMGDNRPCNSVFADIASLDLKVPQANAVYCAFPKRISDRDYREFRSEYLENFYKTIVNQVQNRLIDEKRKAHFLANTYDLITFDDGWYPSEQDKIWSMPEARFTVHSGRAKATKVEISFASHASQDAQRTVHFFAAGEVTPFNLTDKRTNVISFDTRSQDVAVELRVVPPFRPMDAGGIDIRQLGIMLSRVTGST